MKHEEIKSAISKFSSNFDGEKRGRMKAKNIKLETHLKKKKKHYMHFGKIAYIQFTFYLRQAHFQGI